MSSIIQPASTRRWNRRNSHVDASIDAGTDYCSCAAFDQYPQTADTIKVMRFMLEHSDLDKDAPLDAAMVEVLTNIEESIRTDIGLLFGGDRYAYRGPIERENLPKYPVAGDIYADGTVLLRWNATDSTWCTLDYSDWSRFVLYG